VVKKSSKFWQVIVNYGRFVGFKEQLRFFEFFYETALANHEEKKCAPIFYENVRFLGKTQNFQARCGRFSHDTIFFFCSKVLEGFKYDKKGTTKRISKKVIFQATLVVSINVNKMFCGIFYITCRCGRKKQKNLQKLLRQY
jgi:hypothetical protein